KATKANGGDGFANVGEINADFLDLDAVFIQGDLGRIRAGHGNSATSGLKGLTVQSLGLFGLNTGATSLSTNINGKLDFLTVQSDVKEADIKVHGHPNGKIGSITIGGSLLGGSVSQSGAIIADGDIGLVTIKGDVRGGDGDNSAEIVTERKMAGVTIGGA